MNEQRKSPEEKLLDNLERLRPLGEIVFLQEAVADAAVKWRSGMRLAFRDAAWHEMLDAIDALIAAKKSYVPERETETLEG